jgi:hypothetical protein
MAIDIRGIPVSRTLRTRVTAQLTAALARITTKPGGAQATFFDENGPKGGPAMRCALTVRLPSRRYVRAEDTSEDLRAASKRRPKKYYTATRLMTTGTGERATAMRPSGQSRRDRRA